MSARGITIPGDTTYNYGYTYNSQGLLGTLQYPAGGSYAGVKLNYAYLNGVLASVTDASAGTVYWKANTVNGLGQVTQDTLGNGIVTQRSFVATSGLLTRVTSGPSAGSATVQNQSYLYSALGTLLQRQDNNAGLTETFIYDADQRVTQSTLANGSTQTTNLAVAYNPDGSITQKSEAGGTDVPVSYTPQWTSYNYPKSITATTTLGSESATFDYGPSRQRWRMVFTQGSASETTEYIGGLMEKVSSTALGNQYRYYVNGADGTAAILQTNGTGTPSVDYVLEDHEGSVSQLLNSTGTVAANESFTAFGNRREASGWSGPPSGTEEGIMDGITRQGYAGQTVLAQMGLNHMNGRVQDAVTGTFLSPDPYVNDAGNTQDYYRYAYVYNSPLTRIDPTGFDAGCSSGNFIDLGSNADGGLGQGVKACLDSLQPVDVDATKCMNGAWCSSITPDLAFFMEIEEKNMAREVAQSVSNALADIPPPELQTTPNCGTALPNGRTVGSYVQQADSDIDQAESDTEAAGGSPVAGGLGVYLADVGSGGLLDFKNNFRGQGDAGSLGQDGNFAFGAVSAHLFGSGSFGDYMALSGAGVYAIGAGKKGPGFPFVKSPYAADPSAQQNTPAGVASTCPSPAH